MKQRFSLGEPSDPGDPTPQELKKAGMAMVKLNQSKTGFNFTFGVLDFVTLMGNLQLALKHPQNVGEDSQRMKTLYFRMVDLVCTIEPDLRPLLESQVRALRKGGGK